MRTLLSLSFTIVVFTLGAAPATAAGHTWTENIYQDTQYARQCTAYVWERVHQEIGVWPYFPGDAKQWADGAAAHGWTVGTSPQQSSIIIMQPGTTFVTQGDTGRVRFTVGELGHVAWVQYLPDPDHVFVQDRNALGDGRDGQRLIDIRNHPELRYIYLT